MAGSKKIELDLNSARIRGLVEHFKTGEPTPGTGTTASATKPPTVTTVNRDYKKFAPEYRAAVAILGQKMTGTFTRLSAAIKGGDYPMAISVLSELGSLKNGERVGQALLALHQTDKDFPTHEEENV